MFLSLDESSQGLLKNRVGIYTADAKVRKRINNARSEHFRTPEERRRDQAFKAAHAMYRASEAYMMRVRLALECAELLDDTEAQGIAWSCPALVDR